ncbi:YdeI/OmpD-associated family protein [Fodinibius salsisoli]|uniref:YdeI/OmpD-associated family protein n=1 Tax=Fodinibius salsisoli TaxID=2820877 RepID=A0ABT3PIR4_9BACT|nr:YdeI/OmpD-associated family protein [Fodinibius salsisoli]MCW9705638.1 YdeI/OmpD-associated family protein [Fodinibius salsisoli]
MSRDVTFFADSAAFRNWLKANHDSKEVLWVGLYKVSSGKRSIRWEEAVREALCYGWIDGLRKSIDEQSYKIRFTPRRPKSHWSKKNIRMVEELKEEGRMRPPGGQLSAEYKAKIKANEKAWQFLQELAPGYTQTSIHWVMSAKREETRQRRLKVLIESCEQGKKIPLLRRT